jgi:gas vesicle protein
MSNSRIYYSQEAEAKAMRRMTMMTVMWLALGLTIGTIMALLYAPTAGEKTRKNLTKNLGEGWKDSQDAIEPVINRLEKEMGELRQTVEDRIAKLK